MPVGLRPATTLAIASLLTIELAALKLARHGWSALWVALLVLGTLATAAALRWEAKRDPKGTARFLALALVPIVLIGAVAAAVLPPVRGTALAVVAVGGVIAAASAYYWLRIVRSKDEAPNILLDCFGGRQIYEDNGVQWAASQAEADLHGETFVDVYFQNCVDETRNVTLKLEDEAQRARQRSVLEYPSELDYTLRPREIARARLPIRALPEASGIIELYLRARAEGNGGRRVRHFRAQAARHIISTSRAAVALFGAELSLNGCVRFRFRISEDRRNGSWPSLTPHASWETVWPRQKPSSPSAADRPAPYRRRSDGPPPRTKTEH
jgi:hypothetical protein